LVKLGLILHGQTGEGGSNYCLYVLNRLINAGTTPFTATIAQLMRFMTASTSPGRDGKLAKIIFGLYLNGQGWSPP